uniref:Uncharacterized protein n=1 Tax=Setaria italica TaxID=4555 RepID=K3YP09_SETIT
MVGISAHRDGKAMQGDRARGLGIAFSVDWGMFLNFCFYDVCHGSLFRLR